MASKGKNYSKNRNKRRNSPDVEQQAVQAEQGVQEAQEMPAEQDVKSEQEMQAEQDVKSEQEIQAEQEEIKDTEQEENVEYKEKAESQIKESEYLKQLSMIASHDSDLAIAKAQSAELVRQMDNYRAHYERFEKLTRSLIIEYDKRINVNIKRLLKLADSIKTSSDSLDENISQEIQRLTSELESAIEGNIMAACDEQLKKLEEAVRVLDDYSEKVKKRSKRYEGIEKFKFVLFIISSLASPIVLVLMLLSYFHVI